jgi:excisionase family DNA binding protein
MSTSAQSRVVAAGLWDYGQAAHYLHASENTLRKYVSQRRIPFIKIGRAVRFDPERLMEWAQGQAVEPIRETNA